MKVKYVSETSPNTSEKDTPEDDLILTRTFEYDLELDAQKNVIGGEWRSPGHPDFLWTPAPEAAPHTWADFYLQYGGIRPWDGKNALPEIWKTVAIQSASSGEVLAGIVNKLAERAATTVN